MCDSSKALLNACCWVFTGHDSVETYAEACMTNDLPRTKIEIDVAHYIKNWSNCLKHEKKAVKQFYMFAIGQLILCRDKTSATKIIKALLFISLSKTTGTGAPSVKKAVDFIKALITENSVENNEIGSIVESMETEADTEDINEQQSDEFDNSAGDQQSDKNTLKYWAISMREEIVQALEKEDGDDMNPRLCPEFASRLITQIKTIPLWSCIRRDAFGYGRVPPSSAPVESEFKIIKQQVLTRTLRIDVAVETLIKYYEGKLKIIDCSMKNENVVCTDKRSSIPYDTSFTCVSCEKTCNIFSGYTNSTICALCKSKIHLNTMCCFTIDEEDECRVCRICFDSPRKNERLIFNQIENWRDLGHEKNMQTKSLYLSKTNQNLNDVVLSEKCRILPIMKNGNNNCLRLTTFKKMKFSLTNTCSFDSIFQIFLAAATDHKKIQHYMETSKNSNRFFEMVLNVIKTNIQAKTYQTRAELYFDFLEKKIKPNCIEIIDGACNIVGLTNFLIKNSPSFGEISICPAGCKPNIRYLPTITITSKEITLPFDEVIYNHLVLPGVKCRQSACDEIEENNIYKMGKHLKVNVML